MADYGLLVYNQAGQVVIDSEYKNMHYHTSGTATHTCSYTPGVMRLYTDVSFPSIDKSLGVPIVAIRPTSYYTAFFSLLSSGSYWTGFRILVESSAAGSTFQYIVFRPGPASAGGTYGLLVYNSGGELVYNSNEKTLKIKGFHTGTLDPGGDVYNPPSTIVSVTSASNYFILGPVGESTLVRPIGIGMTGIYHFFRGIKYDSSTSVRVGQGISMLGRFPGEYYAHTISWPSGFYLAEVTL
jgi:hypothetical protein